MTNNWSFSFILGTLLNSLVHESFFSLFFNVFQLDNINYINGIVRCSRGQLLESNRTKIKAQLNYFPIYVTSGKICKFSEVSFFICKMWIKSSVLKVGYENALWLCKSLHSVWYMLVQIITVTTHSSSLFTNGKKTKFSYWIQKNSSLLGK